MKAKLIYSGVFVAAFILVTIGIIFLNERYNNIFEFDFTITEIRAEEKASQSDSTDLKDFIASIKEELLDSIQTMTGRSRVDTVFTEVVKDQAIADSIVRVKSKIEMIERELIAKNNEILNLKSVKDAAKDSAYVKWKRDMVKIYESMDAKAAARIIQNLEDNLAKDILFSMKKKKAAEIIMKLNPETASRLTRMY